MINCALIGYQETLPSVNLLSQHHQDSFPLILIFRNTAFPRFFHRLRTIFIRREFDLHVSASSPRSKPSQHWDILFVLVFIPGSSIFPVPDPGITDVPHGTGRDRGEGDVLSDHFFFLSAIRIIRGLLYRCIITKAISIPAAITDVMMKTPILPNQTLANIGRKLNTTIVSCTNSD